MDKELLNKLCSGIFSDLLDEMGYTNQVAEGWSYNNKNKFFGVVRTMELVDTNTGNENMELGLTYLDTLNVGDVLVIKGSNKYAYFGELMCTISERSKISGVIIDGLTRDTSYTFNSELPILSRGYTSRDIKLRGMVKSVGNSIIIDGVNINDGDYVFGDTDSTVFIPKELLTETLLIAKKMLVEEDRIKNLIERGTSVKKMLESVKSF
jgi:regulator of RNase E activity RraA